MGNNEDKGDWVARTREEDYRQILNLVGRNFCILQFLQHEKLDILQVLILGNFAGIYFQETKNYFFQLFESYIVEYLMLK